MRKPVTVHGRVDAATVGSNIVRFLTSVESENTTFILEDPNIFKASRIP